MATAGRILIDATMTRRGGGFTYLVNLLPRLALLAPERSFRLLLRSAALRDAIPPAPNLEVDLLPEAGLARRLHFLWAKGPAVARAWEADLYFAAGELAPPNAPCPVVPSFRNPNVFTTLDQGWYPYQVFRLGVLRRACERIGRSAARVLFVSHDSAGWIGDRVRLPEAKRAVVHHGVDVPRFEDVVAPRPHPRPYALSVSSIYRYKNFVRLIEAWAFLAGRRGEVPDLVIVGDDMDPEYSARMRAARRATGRLASRIHLVGEVPYAEIPAWYAGARLFAFPSYLETFGHPLLEAMAAGVPVVAAETPVAHEVAGDAALYADSNDPLALSLAIERALFDRPLRDLLVARGRRRARGFSWADSARAHLALFDAAATRPQTRS